MNKYSLLFFVLLNTILFSMSTTVNANPGDDVWFKITWLHKLISSVEDKTHTLEQTVQQEQIMLQNLQSQMNHLAESKAGQQGPQGAQGPQGEQGIPGIPGEQGPAGTATTHTHALGDLYHGGIIFWLDETKEHGLIASLRDVSHSGVQWRNGIAGNKVTNARGDGIGAGETNTRLIIALQTADNQKGSFAALLATHFQVLEDGTTLCHTPISADLTCYGGWYLPSAFELQLLHRNLQQNNLSTFAPEFYWSSTEANVSDAWLQNFSTGELIASSKSNTVARVRAVSRF